MGVHVGDNESVERGWVSAGGCADAIQKAAEKFTDTEIIPSGHQATEAALSSGKGHLGLGYLRAPPGMSLSHRMRGSVMEGLAEAGGSIRARAIKCARP